MDYWERRGTVRQWLIDRVDRYLNSENEIRIMALNKYSSQSLRTHAESLITTPPPRDRLISKVCKSITIKI